MKNLFLSVLALLTMSTVFSQETLSGGNGGQQNQNTVVRLDYAGGKVQVTSKIATCDSYFEVNFGTVKDTIVKVGPLQSVLVPIPAGYTGKVKAKLDFGCSTDKGWVEMQIATPLKFLNFKVNRISDTECYIDFETAEVVNVKEIYIKISLDGKTFTVAKTLKPNQTVYHEYLDLTPFLPKKK